MPFIVRKKHFEPTHRICVHVASVAIPRSQAAPDGAWCGGGYANEREKGDTKHL